MEALAGQPNDDADTRIEQAAKSLEARIKQRVAEDIERALDASDRKRD
jgi:hypothetical protein